MVSVHPPAAAVAAAVAFAVGVDVGAGADPLVAHVPRPPASAAAVRVEIEQRVQVAAVGAVPGQAAGTNAKCSMAGLRAVRRACALTTWL